MHVEPPAAGELPAAIVRKIHGSLAAQGLMRHLQARIVRLAPGECEIELPFSDKVSQQHGYFHGGAIGGMLEMAAFTALQRRNVPSRLVMFPDENHWILKPQNSIQWHETVLAWLDQWVRKGGTK